MRSATCAARLRDASSFNPRSCHVNATVRQRSSRAAASALV